MIRFMLSSQDMIVIVTKYGWEGIFVRSGMVIFSPAGQIWPAGRQFPIADLWDCTKLHANIIISETYFYEEKNL